MNTILKYRNELLNFQNELKKIEDQMSQFVIPLDQFLYMSFQGNKQICVITEFKEDEYISVIIHGSQFDNFRHQCTIYINCIDFIRNYVEGDIDSTSNFEYKSRELIDFELNLTFARLF